MQIYIYSLFICIPNIFHVLGQSSQEMLQQGKVQYQLLQERGNLPQYGHCWKAAVDHVNEGCRKLSEETQSDIALYLTNCFLKMSGHETYKCELDRKPNLRGICISSMSDRAFHVYTEFYTHTQNMCWFLQGQVWQETIAENTVRVGKQLEFAAVRQEDILRGQQQSLELQEKLLDYGQSLEKVLVESKNQADKVMEEFRVNTEKHQEILLVMSSSLGGLQSWLIGEVSWIDTIIFYVTSAVLVTLFTSSSRTVAARLPILILLVVNGAVERLICAKLVENVAEQEVHLLQNDLYFYTWWCRKIFIAFSVVILISKLYFYKDYEVENNNLLHEISKQNDCIRMMLEKIKYRRSSPDYISEDNVSVVNEISTIYGSHTCSNSFNTDNLNESQINANSFRNENGNCIGSFGTHYKHSPFTVTELGSYTNREILKENSIGKKVGNGRRKCAPLTEIHSNNRYSLRSKNTPDYTN